MQSLDLASAMRRHAKVEFVSLRSCLVNLPVSLYGPLVGNYIRPQSFGVHLQLVPTGQLASNERNIEAYVGWTGLASSSSLAYLPSSDSTVSETIEIDPQFAESIGLRKGDTVEIGLLHDLDVAVSVQAEPLTPDDWDIVELHASFIEENLLSQARVVKIGQEVDVWIFGKTRARLRIVSFSPESPKRSAALLSTDTELSIAPRLRQKSSLNISPISAIDHQSRSLRAGSQRGKKLRVRVLPPEFYEYASAEQEHQVAWVSYTTFCALSPHSIYLPSSDDYEPVTIQMCSAPINPLLTDSTSPNSVERMNNGSDSFQKQSTQAFVRWSKDVPDNHILIQDMHSNAKPWEICILSSRSSSESYSSNNAGAIPRLIGSESNKTLAGVDDVFIKCINYLLYTLVQHRQGRIVEELSGLLITGRSGSGKTSLANAVALALERDPKTFARTLYVDLSKHTDLQVPQAKAFFNYLLEKANWYRPCILVMDNLDKLLTAEVEHVDSFRPRHLTETFLSVFMGNSHLVNNVAIVATAQSDASLHSRVTSSHLFKKLVKLGSPGRESRNLILKQIISSRTKMNLDILEMTLDLGLVATRAEGYVPADLMELVSRAIHQAAARLSKEGRLTDPLNLIQNDFDEVLMRFTPICLKDIKLQTSGVTWSDIGGLYGPKQILRETLEFPTKYAAIFDKCPLRLRSGILLYGYPGCGKTLLASAVAKECGLNFISVKGPEILNKYIGASEQSVRDLFERATAAKPCVLFFDEFDSIAPKRGHDSTGVTDRVVNQILTQMDGAEGLDGVYVLAATSRPDLIDSALLRPGRLDKSVICDLPSFQERREILELVSKKVNVLPTVDWDHFARVTEGFSGADLQAVIYNAHIEVVHTTLEHQSSDGPNDQNDEHLQYVVVGGTSLGGSKAEEAALRNRLRHMLLPDHPNNISTPARRSDKSFGIGNEDLQRSLSSTRPSVSVDEMARLKHIYSAFMSDRSGKLPIPPSTGSVGSRASLM